MADSGLFIGWGDVRTGRNAAANKVFAEALAYWPTLQAAGDKPAALDAAGIERTSITLHVGYGTFKPVRAELVEEHRVDEERYAIAPAAAEAISRPSEGCSGAL